MAIYKIYSLSCPITGEIKYIGKTKNLEKRLKSHLKDCNRYNSKNSCWVKSLLNKGLSPVIDELDSVDYSKWGYWESYYIELFRSFGCLLNNQKFGDNGKFIDVDLKINHSKKVKGKKHTSEFKEAARNRMIGNKINVGKKYAAKEVVCIDILNCSINYYSSTTEASKSLNIKRTAVSNAVNGLTKSVNKRYYFNLA